MRLLVEYLVIIVVIGVVPVFGTNQHLICKTVDDVFTDGTSDSHISTTPRILHGPPGKRGQRGVKGDAGIPGLKGEKGLPGEVDQVNVENMVEEKLREANRQLQDRVEALERLVTKLNSSVASAVRLACAEDLEYEGKCYFAIIHNSADVDYDGARNLCVAVGGTLADILNRQHQDLVVNYIRAKTTLSVTTYIFLGMSYAPSTSTLRWSSGAIVPEDVVSSMRWWSGYPVQRSANVQMAIGVRSNTVGIFNTLSDYKRHGALCEIQS